MFQEHHAAPVGIRGVVEVVKAAGRLVRCQVEVREFDLEQPGVPAWSLWLRTIGILSTVLSISCTTAVEERCRFITEHVPPPAMPPGFAEVDRVLISRATQMVLDAREIDGSLAVGFRKTFGEQALPDLCHRLERARALAAAGKTKESGATYTALLVSSQVIQLAIAVHTMAQHADVAGQPGGHIDEVLKAFALHLRPLLAAALTENPEFIGRALDGYSDDYATWVNHLAMWAGDIEAGSKRIKVAKQIWDICLLVVAAHEAAGAAASIHGAGRPPMPPFPGLVVSGSGMAAASLNPAASSTLAEALRKLIASGAVDAVVVAGMSRMLGRPGGPPPPVPGVPGTLAMGGPVDLKVPAQSEPTPSVKGRLKAASLPTSGKMRYVPPEDWTPGQPLPRGPNHGYIDRFGNEWVKGPSRTPGQPFEWDVQLGRNATDGIRMLSRDGVHLNVSLDGEVTH